MTPARRFALAIVLIVLIVFSAIGWAIWQFGQFSANTRQLARDAQFESFRGCVRGNSQSAKDRINALDNQDPTERIRIIALSPILDCKQSQLTGSSIELSAEQTNAYIRVILRGRFPIVNDGIVVGSRSSLLEGVDSLDNAGSVP